jgi:hypothetical protein
VVDLSASIMNPFGVNEYVGVFYDHLLICKSQTDIFDEYARFHRNMNLQLLKEIANPPEKHTLEKPFFYKAKKSEINIRYFLS